MVSIVPACLPLVGLNGQVTATKPSHSIMVLLSHDCATDSNDRKGSSL